MANPFYQKLHLHELAKALMQFFGLTANLPVGFDANGKLKNVDNGIVEGSGAGGVLSGTYPDPGFAVNMATQAELDAAAATIPGKATGAEVNTGTDDAKFATPLAIAGSNRGGVVLRAYKTADESVTASTALQDDNHLSVTLVAGRTYHFMLKLHAAGSDGELKVALGGTATYTHIVGHMWRVAEDDGTSTDSDIITAKDTAVTAGVGPIFVTIEGSVVVNVGGTFVLRFAQATSDAGADTVKRGSTMIVTDMN
jgi:hypothetical protein